MLHACAERFEVTEILKTFWFLVWSKQGLDRLLSCTVANQPPLSWMECCWRCHSHLRPSSYRKESKSLVARFIVIAHGHPTKGCSGDEVKGHRVPSFFLPKESRNKGLWRGGFGRWVLGFKPWLYLIKFQRSLIKHWKIKSNTDPRSDSKNIGIDKIQIMMRRKQLYLGLESKLVNHGGASYWKPYMLRSIVLSSWYLIQVKLDAWVLILWRPWVWWRPSTGDHGRVCCGGSWPAGWRPGPDRWWLSSVATQQSCDYLLNCDTTDNNALNVPSSLRAAQLMVSFIWNQICLKLFRSVLSLSKSKYLTYHIVSVSKYLNCIFIILTFNYILFDLINIIHIKI